MVIGYTEHGDPYGNYVAKNARKILKEHSYDENTCESADIAGYIIILGMLLTALPIRKPAPLSQASF